MAYVELELPEEAVKLGITKIACNDGVFVIIIGGKEYNYAFPSSVWNRDKQATIDYLHDRIGNGDGNMKGDAAACISQAVNREDNWKLIQAQTSSWNLENTANPKSGLPNTDTETDKDLSTEEKRIQELIKTPVTEKDIDELFDTLSREAPHDKIAIRQLVYGMLSAFTKVGIPHNVNSKESGAGKNYLLELCSRLFPEKYVEQYTGASDKSFLHRRGQLVIEDKTTGHLTFIQPIIKLNQERLNEITDSIAVEKFKRPNLRNYQEIGKLTVEKNKVEREIESLRGKAQKYFSLGDLIIIISDTPQEGFLTTIMSLSSQDTKRRQRYIFTDKTSAGKHEASTNIIDGQPVVFSAQTIDTTDSKRYAEIARRSINVTPNTSTEKITDAIKLMGNQAGLLPEEYDAQVVKRADQQKAALTVESIVEKLRAHSKFFEPKTFGVKIPFLKAIVNSIPKDGVWSMTVMHRIRAYLAVTTKVHMDCRPRIVDTRTGAFYPISTFKDLKITWELMEMGGSNVRAHLAQCYSEVIYPTYIASIGEDPDDPKITGLKSEEIAEAMHLILKVLNLASAKCTQNFSNHFLTLDYSAMQRMKKIEMKTSGILQT